MSLGDMNLQNEVMLRLGVDVAELLKTIGQLQQQNQEMLEMLKAINQLMLDVKLGIDPYINERFNSGLDAINALIAEIERK